MVNSLGELLRQAMNKEQPFARLRFLHGRSFGLGWIKTAVDLREPTATPKVFESELKPGYYWNREIH